MKVGVEIGGTFTSMTASGPSRAADARRPHGRLARLFSASLKMRPGDGTSPQAGRTNREGRFRHPRRYARAGPMVKQVACPAPGTPLIRVAPRA